MTLLNSRPSPVSLLPSLVVVALLTSATLKGSTGLRLIGSIGVVSLYIDGNSQLNCEKQQPNGTDTLSTR